MSTLERNRMIKEASRKLLDGEITKGEFDRVYQEAWRLYPITQPDPIPTKCCQY